MKNIVTLLIAVVATFAGWAQVNVELDLVHRINALTVSSSTPYLAPDGYHFQCSRLQYYLSEIELIHDGGQVTEVDTTWLLVDAFYDTNFSLGSHNITALEAIRFSVGVEEPVNHDDPAAWPVNHPLAPQLPSMHWGWAAGYRFVAFEGTAGEGVSGADDFTVELHGLGTANYNEVEISTSGQASGQVLTVQVFTNYANLLAGIDASGGVISHSEGGDARTALLNMTQPDLVFSNSMASSADAVPVAASSFTLFPNPSGKTSEATLRLDAPAIVASQLNVTDQQGRVVWTGLIPAGQQQIAMPALASGVYFVQLASETSLQNARKWVVSH